MLTTLHSSTSDVGRDSARRELNSLAYVSGDMAKYIEKFERAADIFRLMGGTLSANDELELFRTSLPAAYNGEIGFPVYPRTKRLTRHSNKRP